MTGPDEATPAAFGASAGAGLAPVAGEIDSTKQQGKAGDLHLDADAAKRMLTSLSDAHLQLHRLVARSTEIEAPLQLGDNFIGQALSRKLQGAAAGGTSAAIPVLQAFGTVLVDLDKAVRAAAGMYQVTDEESKDAIDRAVRRFGMQDVVPPEGGVTR